MFVGVGVGAIALAAGATMALWPEGGSPSGPETSAGSSPSAGTTRDLPWGDPVPWDEVGPGWALLAYDAAPEQMAWGEDWNLAGDELWLVSPEGELYFGADVSDLDATYVETWTGSEAWLYGATGYEGALSLGIQYTVDLVTGEATVVAQDSPPRGSYEPTAEEGVYLTRGGCCSCSEITAHYSDGTTQLLNDGCGSASLSPDGTTLAHVVEWDDGTGTFHATFLVSDLRGNATTIADSSLTDSYHEITWLDDESLLVFTDDGQGAWVLATLDVASGVTTPWPGIQPEGYYLSMWASYPGSWMVWNSYEPVMTTRVTDRNGVAIADLVCEYPSCWPYPTGDVLVWVESDLEYDDGLPVGDDLQRLTVIEPVTGRWTPVLEFTREDGHITTILPHPPAYG